MSGVIILHWKKCLYADIMVLTDLSEYEYMSTSFFHSHVRFFGEHKSNTNTFLGLIGLINTLTFKKYNSF